MTAAPTLDRVREVVLGRYPTAKAYGRFAVWRAHRHHERPLLVYQMGKVGSQTVVNSLEAAGLGPALHVHALTAGGIARMEDVYRRNWLPEEGAWHLWRAQHLRPRLERGSGRWRVITLVRDPVARNLSSFFQVGALQYGIDPARPPEELDDDDLAGLVRHFLDTFDHDHPLTWFDDELRTVFDIDVFATPFPTGRGWQVYESERAEVLLVRLEDLRSTFSEAVERFLGVPDVPVVSTNVAEDKAYGGLYERLVREADLPESYVDRMYTSRLARHFYAADELAAFRARWLRRAPNAG